MFLRSSIRVMPGATLLSVMLMAMLQTSLIQAQVPPPPTDEPLVAGPALTGAPDQPEPLLRGPVHEAFAEPYAADPQPGVVVTKEPPAPIEELPPDTKPAGDDVQWIPGYWGWDEERQDFLWVSGLWRSPPPNHRWVPGYWYQVDGGYQWVVGTWVRDTAEEIEYLADAPPATLEQGPVGTAPGDNYFWIPGCWTWGGANYLWRPGYWSIGYDNWIWTPARYYWTPYGYAYCRGFWDRPFIERGYLFAPYYFPQRNYLNVGYRFTPGISLSVGLLTSNFWVAPRYGHYFFGDYYSNYNRYGYQPWHQYHYTRRCYDPIFAHYQRHHHHGGNNHGPGDWNDRNGRSNYYRLVSENFDKRVNNKDIRPPRTWSEQVARYGKEGDKGRDFDRDGAGGRGPGNDRFDNALGRSWDDFAKNGNRDGGPSKFDKLNDSQRDQMRKQIDSFRQLSEQRRDAESKSGRKPNFQGNKLPGDLKDRTADGNRIVGDAGGGVQNRFRLPTPDGPTRSGSKDFGKPGDGNRPNVDRGQGTGDISTTIRGNNEALERAKERFRDASGKPGNVTGKNDLGTVRSGKPGENSGSRSQAFQDAIDKARRERTDATKPGSGNSGIGGINPGGNRPGSTDSIRSQFDRSKLERSQIDRARSGNGEGFNPGGSNKPGGSNGVGNDNNNGIPRSINRPGKVPGTTNSAPNGQADNLQNAIEKARKAMSDRNNAGSGGPSGGPSTRSGGSSDRVRSFNPPSGPKGNPPSINPDTNRTFTPPKAGDAGKPRSFVPPSGGSRSFNLPEGGTRSFDRGSLERKPSGDSGSSRVKSGTSFNPNQGGGSSFRSSPRPSSNPPAVTRSFGGDSNKSPSVTRSFGGGSSKGSSSARSFTPPSGGGSIPSFSRSKGTAGDSAFRSNPGASFKGGSSDSSSSRRSRGKD